MHFAPAVRTVQSSDECSGVNTRCEAVLSEQVSSLKAEMQEYFSEQQFCTETNLVTCFANLTGQTRQLDLLEVCCPWDSPLAKAVQDQGGTVFRIGIHNGFDLSTRGGFLKALHVLRRLRPRYLHLSPPCFPFSVMQNANQRTPEQRQNLEEKRQVGRRILSNCAKLLEIQIEELGADGGGTSNTEEHDGGLEQPLRASSWKEPCVKRILHLCGGRFRVDGCQHGSRDTKTGRLMQKSFGWLSSSVAIKRALHRTCNHSPDMHIPIEGERTAASAVYPPLLCRRFARALMHERNAFVQLQKRCEQIESCIPIYSDGPRAIPLTDDESENLHVEPDEIAEPVVEELTDADRDILRKIRIVHSNLGHPSQTALRRLLSEAGASQRVLELSDRFECEVCRKRGRKAPVRPTAVPAVTEPWDVISIDTFWWSSPHMNPQNKPQEFCVGVSMFDEGSGFHVVGVVRKGDNPQQAITAEEFKRCFRSCWMRFLPKPNLIRYDCEGFFRSLDLIKWLEGLGIRVQPIAGEAPWQMGKHSRHLETAKENASLLASEWDSGVDIEEIFDATVSAKNEFHIHKGFSPNQWAFGQSHSRLGSFLQNGEHVGIQQHRQDMSFEEFLKRKNDARLIFLKQDAKFRIQRAMNARQRKAQMFESGQFVYFFRRGRGHGSRYQSYWYGPAKVVCVEKTGSLDRNQTEGSIVWVIHGSTLYRCAPEQLRPVTHDVSHLSQLFGHSRSPSALLQHAKQSQTFRDVSREIESLPDDDDIFGEDPNEDPTLIQAQEEHTHTWIPTQRLRFKQDSHGGSQEPRPTVEGPGHEARGQDARGSGSGEGVSQDGSSRARGDDSEGRQICQPSHQRSQQGSSILPIPGSTLPSESQIRGNPGLHGTSAGGTSGDGRGEIIGQQSEAERHSVSSQARQEFDDFRLLRREAQRSNYDDIRREDSFQPSSGEARGVPDDAALPRVGEHDQDARRSSVTSPTDARGSPDIEQSHGRPGEPSQPSGDGRDRGRADGSESSRCHRMRSRSRGKFQSGRGPAGIFQCEDFDVECESESNELSNDLFEVGCTSIPNTFVRNKEKGDVSKVNVGVFGWYNEVGQNLDGSFVNSSSETPPLVSLTDTDTNPGHIHFVAEDVQMCEIILTVAPRDVHCKKRNGVQEWVLNQKPKKNAEVKLKHLSEEEKVEFRQAMQGEINSFLERDAIEIASRHGIDPMKLLGMRWVLTYKPLSDENGNETGKKAKARLIIRGYEDPNLLNLKRDSPTLAVQSRNILLSLAAAYHWPIWAGDIKTAFLNGDPLPESEQLFGDPPKEAREIMNMKDEEILRIRKVIYGLLHAPRAWMDKLNSVLSQQGWINSRLESCTWRLFDENNNLCGLIGCHVDDLLVTGHGSLFDEKVRELRSSFPFGSWQAAQKETITFCGCELHQDLQFNVFLTQERYSLSINEIPVSVVRRREPSSLADESEMKQMRATLGALSWRATQTCPWLAAGVSLLQGKQKSPCVEDLLETNKLIRMQRKYADTPLKFSSQIKQPILVTYTDASWACRADGSSQGGQLTVLADKSILSGERSYFSILSWQSRKLVRKARSSTSAEVQMAADATDSHEFIKQTLLEWFNEERFLPHQTDQIMHKVPSVLILDSKNLYDALSRIQTSGLQLEEKRTAIEVLTIRERTVETGIQIRWVDSDQQLADGLSKGHQVEHLLDLLVKGVLSIQFDPLFTSAKKKRAMRRVGQNPSSDFVDSLSEL